MATTQSGKMFRRYISCAFSVVLLLEFSQVTALQTFKLPRGDGRLGSVAACGIWNSSVERPCGVRPRVNTQGLPQATAAFGEFPWQVAVLNVQEQAFLCSGVLISSRGVLTASKCVSQLTPNSLAARVGEWDILSEGFSSEPFQSEDIPVAKKYALSDIKDHKSTKRDVANYALTLLKLRRSPKFDEYPHILPICLPEVKTELTNTKECFISGWAESVEECKVNDKSRVSELTELKTEESVQSFEEECATRSNKDGENDSMSFNQDMNPENEYLTSQSDQGKCCKTSSKILAKIPVEVAPVEQCIEQEWEINDQEMCVIPLENNLLCMADVGSPVICRMENSDISENIQISVKYNSKSLSWRVSKKENEEKASIDSQVFMIVGMVTSSEECSANVSQSVKIISISNSLEPLCKILGQRGQ